MYKFVHINKTGGSSLIQILRKIGITNIIHMKVPDIQKNDKIILFIRDPIERFISSYNYSNKILIHVTDYRTLLKNTFDIRDKDIKTEINNIKIPNLNNVLKSIINKPKLKSIFDEMFPHTVCGPCFYFPDYSILDPNIYYVGKTETFKESVTTFLKKIGKVQKEIEIEFPKLRSSNKIGIRLTDDNVDYLKTLLKDEFVFLKKLVENGHLDQEYLESMRSKTEYFC